MTRLSYFEFDTMPPELAALWGDRPRINLFRVLPHARSVAPGFLALGEALRKQSHLDLRLRELVILRVGALSRAAYEVHQHKRVGRETGLTEAQIAAAVREGPEEALGDWERMVLRFTDAVVLEVKAPKPLYDAVAANLTERQLAELLLNIGFYTMVCRFLENVELDIEAPGALQS
jgi:alkylhydroperoxidase family enzyme